MTSHPVMFDTSPDASCRTNKPAHDAEKSDLKSTMLRASVVGLFGGVALIGLIENATRFGDPNALYADARQLETSASDAFNSSLAERQDVISVQVSRSDRLDIVMTQAPSTDVATR